MRVQRAGGLQLVGSGLVSAEYCVGVFSTRCEAEPRLLLHCAGLGDGTQCAGSWSG